MKENYSDKLQKQVRYLNECTLIIWCCGVFFTRVATGIWLGDRPVYVLTILLIFIYIYMHLGYYLTMLIRFPFVLLLLYLSHVHFFQPGDFFLTHATVLTWKHLLIIWLAMNFSFLFHADVYPFKLGTLHWMSIAKKQAFSNGSIRVAEGKVIAFSSRSTHT